MTNPAQKSNDAVGPTKQTVGRRRAFWTAMFLLWVLSTIVPAYMRHQSGRDWLSAFGLPLDRGFLRLIGDAAIPIFIITLILQQVKKLPPSREKTVLSWLGWSFFVFLIVWWSFLGHMLFGP